MSTFFRRWSWSRFVKRGYYETHFKMRLSVLYLAAVKHVPDYLCWFFPCRFQDLLMEVKTHSKKKNQGAAHNFTFLNIQFQLSVGRQIHRRWSITRRRMQLWVRPSWHYTQISACQNPFKFRSASYSPPSAFKSSYPYAP